MGTVFGVMDPYGLWLLKQALSGVIGLFPVTIALLFGVGVAILRLLNGERPNWAVWSVVLIAIASPFALLYVGVSWRATFDEIPASDVGRNILNAVAMTLLAIMVVGVALSGKNRLASALIAAASAWFSFWAYFVSVMSVTGSWL